VSCKCDRFYSDYEDDDEADATTGAGGDVISIHDDDSEPESTQADATQRQTTQAATETPQAAATEPPAAKQSRLSDDQHNIAATTSDCKYCLQFLFFFVLFDLTGVAVWRCGGIAGTCPHRRLLCYSK